MDDQSKVNVIAILINIAMLLYILHWFFRGKNKGVDLVNVFFYIIFSFLIGFFIYGPLFCFMVSDGGSESDKIPCKVMLIIGSIIAVLVYKARPWSALSLSYID
jgi:hypothetical protein